MLGTATAVRLAVVLPVVISRQPGIVVLVGHGGAKHVIATIVRFYHQAILAISPRRWCLLTMLVTLSQPGKLGDGQIELDLCGSEGQRGILV